MGHCSVFIPALLTKIILSFVRLIFNRVEYVWFPLRKYKHVLKNLSISVAFSRSRNIFGKTIVSPTCYIAQEAASSSLMGIGRNHPKPAKRKRGSQAEEKGASRVDGGRTRGAPTGVGRKGSLSLDKHQLDGIMSTGVDWIIEQGYGWDEDLEHMEAGGRLELADPTKVSPHAKERGRKQVGTLGSGNHFLEIQLVDEIYDENAAKTVGITHKGQVTVMIHSGSRGLGHQVCGDYIKTMTHAMRKYNINVPDRELCSAPTTSPEGQAYLGAMSAAANYAWANRQTMMHWTREVFSEIFKQSAEDLDMRLVYDVAHNIGKVEEHDIEGKRTKVLVHRKGATRAFPPGHPETPAKYKSIGQPVLIPGTMGTASYILVGSQKGMELTFGSTAHGAGRFMSRSRAKRQFYGKEVQDKLAKEGIIVRASKGIVIAEEAPGAYKDVDEVVRVSDDLGIATKIVRLRPIGVIKG